MIFASQFSFILIFTLLIFAFVCSYFFFSSKPENPFLFPLSDLVEVSMPEAWKLHDKTFSFRAFRQHWRCQTSNRNQHWMKTMAAVSITRKHSYQQRTRQQHRQQWQFSKNQNCSKKNMWNTQKEGRNMISCKNLCAATHEHMCARRDFFLFTIDKHFISA